MMTIPFSPKAKFFGAIYEDIRQIDNVSPDRLKFYTIDKCHVIALNKNLNGAVSKLEEFTKRFLEWYGNRDSNNESADLFYDIVTFANTVIDKDADTVLDSYECNKFDVRTEFTDLSNMVDSLFNVTSIVDTIPGNCEISKIIRSCCAKLLYTIQIVVNDLTMDLGLDPVESSQYFAEAIAEYGGSVTDGWDSSRLVVLEKHNMQIVFSETELSEIRERERQAALAEEENARKEQIKERVKRDAESLKTELATTGHDMLSNCKEFYSNLEAFNTCPDLSDIVDVVAVIKRIGVACTNSNSDFCPIHQGVKFLAEIVEHKNLDINMVIGSTIKVEQICSFLDAFDGLFEAKFFETLEDINRTDTYSYTPESTIVIRCK